MGHGIYAFGQATYYRDPRRGEIPRQALGDGVAVVRRPASSNERDGMLVNGLDPTA
jgi:hypothetical protein